MKNNPKNKKHFKQQQLFYIKKTTKESNSFKRLLRERIYPKKEKKKLPCENIFSKQKSDWLGLIRSPWNKHRN